MTYADWAAYFAANQTHFDHLSWDDPYRLTERERRAAGRSLQHFQRGESSEGQHLLGHAQATDDAADLLATRRFIREEGDHARVLGQFLERQGLPLLRRSRVDEVFRWLRRRAGRETTIRLLLTAEIIAAVYYRALYHATFSGLLQQICLRILRDEAMHINFQCFILQQLRPVGGVGGWLRRQLHGLFLAGTAAVVWLCYNRTLWAGGMGPIGFFAAVAQEWDRACQLLRHPTQNGISWPEPPATTTRRAA